MFITNWFRGGLAVEVRTEEEEHTIVVYSGTIGTEYKPMNNIGVFYAWKTNKKRIKRSKIQQNKVV